jgi:heterodisulfide reductase subunit A-like polyferredoxin
MNRIGVFIDPLQELTSLSLRERIARAVGEIPGVVLCIEEKSFGSSEGQGRISERIRAGAIDRVLIVGGSPKRYETSFLKGSASMGVNPYLIAVADISFLPDTGAGFTKAKEVVSKAIRRLSAALPIERETLPLGREIVVLGGGIVGISVARALASANIRVTIVEKEKRLGGNALELHRFYNRQEDVQTWLAEKISDLLHDANISVMTEAELKSVSGHVGRFALDVSSPTGNQRLSASAIVVATGCMTRPERTGVFAHRRAVSFSEMERLLSEQPGPGLHVDENPVETVAFLLDDVNEDFKVDSINAIKQAMLLQDNHRCQAVILCRDVKVSTDGMERLYRQAREKGVLFFKYDTPPQMSVVEDRIRIDVSDTSTIHREDQWQVSILSDILVSGDAFVPNPETERIASLLRLHIGSRGFLMEDNPQLLRVRSNRRGIFVAGGCRLPQHLSECLIEARAAAEEARALLSNGAYIFDLAVAEVDPKKCAVCYTCPRVCPHSAITVEKYAERNIYAVGGTGEAKWGAAKVDPAACYGCGICVAECPARAITLRHEPDDQIYAQMNVSTLKAES